MFSNKCEAFDFVFQDLFPEGDDIHDRLMRLVTGHRLYQPALPSITLPEEPEDMSNTE